MIDTLVTKSIIENTTEYLEKMPLVGLTPTEQEMIAWLLDYNKKHGKLPTQTRFEDCEYGHYYNYRNVADPFTDIYERTLQHLKTIYFNDEIHKMQETLEAGKDISGGQLNELAKKLGMFSDVEVNDIFTVDRSKLYSHKVPDNVIMFDWIDIDSATGGIYPGEVCLMIARPGTGKSLISFYLAVNWAKREKKKVLVVSSEMAIQQMASRFDAMLASFNPLIHRMKDDFSKLDQYYKAVQKELDKIKKSGGNVIFPHQGTISVNGIRGLLNEHEPDILIVDGVYMIEHSGSFSEGWQKEAAVITELKQVALDYDIPLFSTTQVNRSGGSSHFDLENIAGSDKYGQVADVVIGAWPFADEVQSDIELKIIKNRNGKRQGITTLSINWNESTIQEKKVSVGKKL